MTSGVLLIVQDKKVKPFLETQRTVGLCFAVHEIQAWGGAVRRLLTRLKH